MIRLLKFIKPFDKVILLCLFFCPFEVFSKEIPDFVYFGNIKLKINADAKRQIQSNVYEILKDQHTFKTTLRNIEIFSPIIENILHEEGLPADFKYLAVQNHSDINGKNNSVLGFWQLDKKFAINELSMQVNDEVDERLDIIASTKATARYLRRNNLFFKNWLFTMLSLKVGYEDARKYVSSHYKKEDYIGVQSLEINGNTPSYILSFLAHKIAFEEELKKGNTALKIKLMQYTGGANKTLSQIAHQFKVPEKDLIDLNQWLKRNKIPNDKSYNVLIPANEGNDNTTLIESTQHNKIEKQVTIRVKRVSDNHPIRKEDKDDTDPIQIPEVVIEEKKKKNVFGDIIIEGGNGNDIELEPKNDDNLKSDDQSVDVKKTINVQYHTILTGQTLYDIASKYSITIAELRYWNNLGNNHLIYAGQKLIVSHVEMVKEYETHLVDKGETLSNIAQRYNVDVQEIVNWNSLDINAVLQIGQRLMIYQKIYKSSFQENSFFDRDKKMQVVEKLSNTGVNKANKKIKK